MFFSDEMIDALFLASFQGLSNDQRTEWYSRAEANRSWNSFLNSSYITIVQGEVPSVADSGHLFARKARDLLGMPQEQLLSPEAALKAVLAGFSGPIVFVDDFVGSGNQFLATWSRMHNIAGHGRTSFAQATSGRSQPICYCTAMLTELGRKNILSKVPSLHLTTGNLLTASQSWVDEATLLWPETRVADGIKFIRRLSASLGYGDDGGSEQDWRGFHCLGLGLAFEHTTPDATLPLFYHNRDKWRPLVRRS